MSQWGGTGGGEHPPAYEGEQTGGPGRHPYDGSAGSGADASHPPQPYPAPYPPAAHGHDPLPEAYYSPGAYQPGPYQPGPYPGPYQPGPYHPGPYQPASHQPGFAAPMPYSPGPYSPGPYSPGPYSPGPYSPGPPAPYAQGQYPQAGALPPYLYLPPPDLPPPPRSRFAGPRGWLKVVVMIALLVAMPFVGAGIISLAPAGERLSEPASSPTGAPHPNLDQDDVARALRPSQFSRIRKWPQAEVVRRGHAVVVSDRDPDEAEDVARLTDEAMVHVDEMWGERAAQTVFVIAPAHRVDFESVVGSSFEEGYAGVAFYSSDAGVVVLEPRAWNGMPDEYRRGLLAHELTHTVTLTDADRVPDQWLAEGMASYVELKAAPDAYHYRRDLRDAVRDGKPPTQFPSLSLFREEPDMAYLQSLTVVEYIAETYGEDKAKDFYLAAASTSREEDAARDVLGVDLDQLEDDWIADVVAQAES